MTTTCSTRSRAIWSQCLTWTREPSKAEDVRLDRRAGIVLAVIVGGLIVIELVVVPLLAR